LLQHFDRRCDVFAGDFEHARHIVAFGSRGEGSADVGIKDRLELVIAKTDHGDDRQRSMHLQQHRHDLVAGTVHTSNADDRPAALVFAHELLAAQLRLLIVGRTAIRTKRRDEDEARRPRPFRFGQDVLRAAHVDVLERQRRRFRDDAGDVNDRIAVVGGAFQLGRLRDVGRERLDTLWPFARIFVGVTRQQADMVSAIE
jgi:hypothetical protein